MKKKLLKCLCINLSACILATSMPVTEVVYASENKIEVPVEATIESEELPTAEPTSEPTLEPTQKPTVEPIVEPSVEPTVMPEAEATAMPTTEPVAEATAEPTSEPVVEATIEPTAETTAELQEVSPTAQPDAFVEELLKKAQIFYPDMYINAEGLFEYTDVYGVIQTYDPYDPEFSKYMLSQNLVTMEESVTSEVVGSNTTVSPFTGKTYTHESHVANKMIRHGIDVSKYQGNVDWAKAKAAGVEFAIVRVGYRGYGAEGNMAEDNYAVQNIKNAYNAGVKVGVYFFSQAITKAEAQEEAQLCYNFLKNNGLQKYITLPVFIDYEYSPTGTSGRLYDAHLSNAQRQAICDKFGTTIQSYGYEPGIYANYSMLTDDMQPTSSSMYSDMCYWIARYNTATHYSNQYSFWQYSSQGVVDGITVNTVDCNFWYDNRKSISDSSVTVNIGEESDYVSDISSILTVYDNARKYTLKEDKDYTLSVTTNTEDDEITATITITGIGIYEGTITQKAVMTPVSLHSGMVSTISAQTYTGSEITTTTGLSVTISHAGTVLEEGKDYTLSYENNVNVGTATITIIGMGYYTGEVTQTFTIAPQSITADMLSDLPSVTYTGEKITLENMGLDEAFVFVSKVSQLSGAVEVLTPEEDYVLTYESNQNAGTAKITVSGIGNYTGKVTTTFKIVKRVLADETYEPLEDVVVTVGGTAEVYQAGYTGEAIKPAVTVTVNGRKLKKADFTVSYSNNTKASEKACVIIKGKGNYKGTIKRYFTIVPKAAARVKLTSAMVSLESNCIRMSGSPITPEVYVARGGVVLAENVDYTVKYTNADNVVVSEITQAGIYYVKVTGIGAYKSTVSKKLEVLDYEDRFIGKDYTEVSFVTEGELFYTGKAIKPAVKVTDKTLDNQQLKKDVDYTISYTDNKNAGTARYTIKGKGKYTGTYTGTFQIKPAQMGDLRQQEQGKPIIDGNTVISLNKYAYNYNGKKQTPTVTVKWKGKTLKKNTDYTIDFAAFNNEDNLVGRKNVDIYIVCITFKGNYEGKALIAYEIKPVKASKLKVTVPKVLYNGQPQVPALEDMTVKLGSVTLDAQALAGVEIDAESWSNNTQVSTTKRTAGFTLTVTGEHGNFVKDSTKKVSFSISKRPISNKTHSFTIGGAAVSGSDSELALVYTGSKFKQSNGANVVIEDIQTGSILQEGIDYTLKYSNNKNVGTAKVVVTGKGGYNGTKTIKFKIVGKPIGDGIANENYRLVIGSGEEAYVYTGKAIKPTVKLYEGDTKLKKNTDYTVKYQKNTNAGTATVTVTGKGKYAGTIRQNFIIQPKSKDDAKSIKIGSIATQKYTGKTIVPAVKVVVDGKTLEKGKDYTVSVINSTRLTYTEGGVRKGTATAIITGTGNYKGLLAKKSFTVKE